MNSKTFPKMKSKILYLILLAGLLLAFAIPMFAQTNNLPGGIDHIDVGGITLAPVPTNLVPPSSSSLISTVVGFLGSFTDKQTFLTNDTLDVWTSAEQVGGNNTAAALGLSYNTPWKVGNVRLGVESVTRAAGIGGTILSQSGGINAQYAYKDVKMVAFVEGGYEFDLKKPAVEFGVRIWKALTDNTYTGPTLSWRSGTANHATTIGWCIGGKF